MTEPGARSILHATTVSIADRGLLIIGPSGAGKSGLALQLMALGAALVADDRSQIWVQDAAIWAGAPPGLPALIEARGVGLLPVPQRGKPVRLVLVVDLGQSETDRLPPLRTHPLLGQTLPLVFYSAAAHFPAAILHYIHHGRSA